MKFRTALVLTVTFLALTVTSTLTSCAKRKAPPTTIPDYVEYGK